MNTHSLLIAAAVGSTLVGTAQLSAQSNPSPAAPPRSGWELVVPTGSLIPTGGQREAIKRGNLTAVQLAYVPRPSLALTATLGWGRTRDLTSADAPKLDVFTYDAGAELRAPRWIDAKRLTFTPFAGVGAGARTYDHRSLNVAATHNLAAYASVGGEVGVSRIRLRVDVRNYLSGFRPLRGAGATDARNDVVVMTGLRVVRR